MRSRLFLCLALAAAGASASSVSNEISVNSTQPTDVNPRSGSVSDSLRASFDVAEPLSLNLGASLTSQNNSPAPVGNDSGSAAVALLTAGIDWELADSWTLGLSADWSPHTTQFADAPLPLAAETGTAHIRSRTAQVAGGVDLSYDTGGTSELEWSFSAGLEVTRWNIDQTVPLVTTANGTVLTSAQVRSNINTYCSRHPAVRNCGRAVLRDLTATPFVLDSQQVSASATAIVRRDTDLTLSADYYNYVEDATQAAFASLIFNGRGGAGVPVAPLHYVIRPEVTHRFGDLSAKLWVQGGEYVPNAGGTTAGAGLRLQYKFTRTYRMWISASGQRDEDEHGNETRSGALALGAGYRF